MYHYGGKGLRKALVHVLGDRAVIQRCQLHKMRNVEGYLPKAKRAYVLSQMRQAYKAQTASSARKLLVQLASCLERGGHEDAAGSLREGLEETLTVLKLGSVAHADQIAVHDERCREHNELHSAHDEKRQALAQPLDDSSLGRSVDSRSSQKFRRLKGYSEMNTLVAALARLHPASNASDTVAA